MLMFSHRAVNNLSDIPSVTNIPAHGFTSSLRYTT